MMLCQMQQTMWPQGKVVQAPVVIPINSLSVMLELIMQQLTWYNLVWYVLEVLQLFDKFEESNNFYLIILGIPIACLLSNVWILQEDATCQSLLGVEGLKKKINVAVDMTLGRQGKQCGCGTVPSSLWKIPAIPLQGHL